MTKNQRCRDRPGDDVLGETVGEVFLLGIAAHVLERQDGDRRFVRERQQFGARHQLDGIMGGGRLRQRAWTGRDGHRRRSLLDFADEAKSALMQRANEV